MESVCNECAERSERACSECECSECRETVTLNARILRVCRCELLVCDQCGCQEVLVHTNDACRFQAGQCVSVTYNGAMTMSIPPQITADCVRLMNGCGNHNNCCC